jgi:site-specific DNA-methyltransferase (adenine-specific)
MLEFDKIYNMDCIDGMLQMDSESVDLVITSPPYNLGNCHHTYKHKFKPYDDDMPEADYQNWQIKVLDECHRLLKPNGSVMYNHKNRIKDGIMITPYEWLLKTKLIIKQEIVWQNGTGLTEPIRFYPSTERIYWLSKSVSTQLVNVIHQTDVIRAGRWMHVGTQGEHKRAFPERMVSDLIDVFPESEVILDPFMGSGTVAYVSKNKQKHFIGFELEKKYCEIAERRIKQEPLWMC